MTSMFVIFVHTFWATRFDNSGDAIEQGVLVVTRGFAMVSLVIALVYCLFRWSHA